MTANAHRRPRAPRRAARRRRARGLAGAVAHRGAGRHLPRAAGRGDRLVHPPGRPRRSRGRPGARHQEPRPRRDRRAAAGPRRRQQGGEPRARRAAAARARHRRVGHRHRDGAGGGRVDAAAVRDVLGWAGDPGWLAEARGGVVRARAAGDPRAWSCRSGATRGWWSAGRRSPPTCWPGPASRCRRRGCEGATRRSTWPSIDDPAVADLVLLPDEPYVFTAGRRTGGVRAPADPPGVGPAAHLVRALRSSTRGFRWTDPERVMSPSRPGGLRWWRTPP